MLVLDIRTMTFVSTLIAFTVALLIMLPLLRARDGSHALNLWTLAFGLRALGFLGIFFRGAIPDFLSLPVANTLIVVGEVLFLAGVRMFTGRQASRSSGLLIVAFGFILLLLTYGRVDYRFFVLTISLYVMVIDCWIARALTVFATEPGLFPAQRVTACFFLAAAALLLLRSVFVLTGGRLEGVFAPGPVSVTGFICATIIPICFGFGFLALINKRAECEKARLIARLEDALASIDTLSGLLPICAACKKIRDDRGYWHQVEVYLSKHSRAEFSHGLCPDCVQRLYPNLNLESKPRS